MSDEQRGDLSKRKVRNSSQVFELRKYMGDSGIDLEKSGGTAWNSFFLTLDILMLKCLADMQGRISGGSLIQVCNPVRNPVGARCGCE